MGGAASEVDDRLNEKQAQELVQPFKLDLDTYYEDNLSFRKKLGKGAFSAFDCKKVVLLVNNFVVVFA